MFIFLDESGCLGFDFSKRKTSERFVITVLVLHDIETYKQVGKAVNRTLRNKLNKGGKKRRVVSELKGSKTSLEIKEYFYRNMPRRGWEIYTVALNKRRVFDHLRTRTGKKRLYNYLARFILEKIDFSKAGQTANLIVDRCKNKEEIRDFNNYVANHLEGCLPLKISLNVTHEASQNNAGLQAVDLFCWGIARKYEGDVRWYTTFRGSVRFDTEYLPE